MVFLEPEVWLTAMGQHKKFNPLSKQLIKHMLGFEEEGSENFVRSEQYIMSNLLYHNYTAVNRHAIQRSIKGLELKFDIHGQKDRSEKLKNLIEKFTTSSCFKDHPEVEIEWAIVSFVLLLSNNPTSVPIIQIHQPTSTIGKIDSTEEDDDDIDWVAYLKEDNHSYELNHEDDLSDWSSDEDEPVLNLKNIDYNDGNTDSNTALVGSHPKTTVRSLSSIVNKQTEEGRAWLAENCQAPYWLNSCNGSEEGVKKLSEWVVLREIVWMLLKPAPAVLFYIDQEGKFAVNENITVSSLSEAAFHSYLEKLCEPLNQLKDIDKFFTSLEDQQQEVSEPNVSATVLAYASGLRIWMHEFWSHLNILEDKVRKQEETCTLFWLENELTPWFQKIYVVHDVHSSAVLDSDNSTQAKAIRLLGVLNEGIVRAVKVDIRTILLRLFLHSLRHYLRLMHHWLYEGLLQDYTNEFIIHRNNEISVRDGNFWSSAFTLEYQELLDASDADSPIRSTLQPLVPILDSLVCVGKTRELLAALLSDNSSSSYDEDVTTSKLIAKDVSQIGALPSLQQLINKTNSSLEERIINHIKEAVMTSSQVEDSEEEIEEHVGHETLSSQPATEVDFLLYEWQERDPLLLAAFPDIREPFNNSQNQGKESNRKTNLRHTDKLSQHIESIVADRSKSVIQLLVSGLRPLIQTEQHTLSGQLTQIFKHDHQLSLHFNALRSVILMEAGDVMHEFYSHLFAKLEAGETMGSNELTLHLQSCVSRLYPDLAHRFSISCNSEEENISEDSGGANIDPAERQRRGNLKRLKIGLPDIKIHYEVPWPISLVMTEDIWERCNKLFAFTLSLKRATYGMERLQFRELASWQSIMSSSLIMESSSKEANNSLNPLQSRLHRLQLLRHWLLYFSHSVHDHFANSVFMQYHVSVEALLAKSPPLDTIIKDHEKLLQEICNQSLLTNERRSPLNMILGRIFELMMKLGDVWRRDVGSLNSETLRGLEEEYALCHGFLANFLINLTKTHHIPHMAGLTHAIVSSTPTKVTF